MAHGESTRASSSAETVVENEKQIHGEETDDGKQNQTNNGGTNGNQNDAEKGIEKPTDPPPAPAQGDPGDQFPDGGRQAWSVVVGGWCCMYAGLGWVNCIGVFQTIYEQDQLRSYSASTIAWILSLQTFVMFGGAPIIGKIFDGYGPRYILLGGTLLHIFGLMMMSLSTQYYQFILAQSICTGFGACAIFYCSTNSIATWFKKHRALALGISSSGAAAGGVVTPILIHQLYASVGFGWAVRATAFVYLGLLVIANTFLKSRLQHTPKPFRIMDFIDPLKEPRFALVVCANFFFFLGLFIPSNFIILSAIQNGMSPYLAGYLLAILNGVSALGRIAAGGLADKMGRFNSVIMVTGLTTIFVLAMWIPSRSNAPLIVFAGLIGATTGALIAQITAVIAQISEIKQIGIRNGTNFFFISFAALIGNPIAGALEATDNGGFLYLQIFCGVTIFISMCFFIASRTVQVGLKWKVV